MSHPHDANALFENDAQLKPLGEDLRKYQALADDAALNTTVAALKEKHGAEVHVVDSREAALKALLGSIPAGASISAAGSHTLTQIGYDAWAKEQKDHKDYKGLSLAKYGTPEGAELRRQGLAADVFFTSVCAISQEGELYAVDLTGTRTGGFLSSKHLVVVAGTQKIVKDHAAVLERTESYCLALESARVRDAYKIPGSQIVNAVQLNQKSPFEQKGRLTVILIKEALGY